ncbi:MAG: recombinase family protein [Chloroflexota bacterium]
MSRKDALARTRHIALCYVRQSKTRDATDMNSPERQRANIQAVCDAEGWTPLWFVDAEGHKSGRYEKNRPAWLRLKQHFNNADVVALVANDMSRLHRKAWRVGRMVDEVLEPLGIRLFLAAPGRQIDTSTPIGKMMLMMIAMQDENYANDIAERTKDAIAYRKSLGKSVGMPPFGTIRDEEGYLIPSERGAWLLPDGTFKADRVGSQPPEPHAVWRGYYECAKRILELYAEDRMGRERIAYAMNEEGWAFRDRKKRPRPITEDDVRRTTSNWRGYAGIVVDGRAIDLTAAQIENPTDILHDTGKAVFPLELLHQVATVQEKRSHFRQPRGGMRKKRAYALSHMTYCAHCERLARKHDNPDLRSRLSGVDQHGKLRYRHVTGVKCGCTRRSLFTHVIEDEFRLLINQLALSPNAFDTLLELAVQSEHGQSVDSDEDAIEAQKVEGIAKCKRRIEAARNIYLDGDMSREEYLAVKE